MRALGAGIGRAGYAGRLLSLGLVRALLALDALVERTVEVGAGLADRQRALLDLGRAQARCRPAQRACLAGRLYALPPVGTPRAGLALALDGQLLPGAALVATLLARDSFGRARRLAQAADQAREAALLGLVEPVAAAPAGLRRVVVVLAGGAALLAVVGAAGTRADRHRGPARDHRALVAPQLAGLALVAARRAEVALARRRVVVAAHGAGNCREESQTV